MGFLYIVNFLYIVGFLYIVSFSSLFSGETFGDDGFGGGLVLGVGDGWGGVVGSMVEVEVEGMSGDEGMNETQKNSMRLGGDVE